MKYSSENNVSQNEMYAFIFKQSNTIFNFIYEIFCLMISLYYFELNLRLIIEHDQKTAYIFIYVYMIPLYIEICASFIK